jgi:serine protease
VPEDYAYTAGTSFAAPHVAGVIALLFSLDPKLSAEEAVEIIRTTAEPITGSYPLGAGQINARAALTRLKPGGGNGGGEGGDTTPGRLNINIASVEQLTALPLVGGWRARRIVEYRESRGRFTTIWQLALTGAFDSWTIGQLSSRITV